MAEKIELLKAPEPTKTVRFVKVEEGHENVYDLPIDSNFNDGSGVIFYHNLGFIEYDRFYADKKAKEVAAAQAKELEEAKAKLAEVEEAKSKKGK